MGRIHSMPEKWLPVSIAPSDADLEVCVLEAGQIHALIFPCRKSKSEWVDAATKAPIDIRPSHWRLWAAGTNPD
jgi:hypothetical protein